MVRVGLVGAGSSGIATLKALVDAGHEVTCWEAGDRVGGNWVFQNSNGMSSAYRTLHINTSRERMQYAALPMPAEHPDFPHHTHIAAYFADFVERFDLARHIRFRTLVTRAEPTAPGWRVTTDDGTTTQVDALVVANGHHWDPRWPEPLPPGTETFDGEQVHAHHVEDNAGWAGRRVVVVGMGNSAMDLAVEASWVADAVWLSARTPAHVLPKYVFGRPLDTLQTGRLARLPWRLRQVVTHAILRVAVGPLERYGLPTPAHGVFQAHPTISDAILSRIAHGEVTPAPGIAAIDGGTVRFTDGRVAERVDVIVWATGYRISFPFLDPGLLSAPDNDIGLYRRIWPVDVADLAVVGLVQPLGAVMPLAEKQGELVAEWLAGRWALPDPATMRRSIAADRAAVRRRYVGSRRHTIQVDFDAYLHELQVEQARGRRRAGRG